LRVYIYERKNKSAEKSADYRRLKIKVSRSEISLGIGGDDFKTRARLRR